MMKKFVIGMLFAGLLVLGFSSWPAPGEAYAAEHSASVVTGAYDWALSQQGAWYLYGGTGPGYDCSGLVYEAYLHQGVDIGRDTYAMLASPVLTPTTTPHAGDLAFFGTGHVELYAWPGTTFGALESGTQVGYHHWSAGWHPTAFYTLR